MGQIEPGDREEMLLAGILNGDTESNIEPGSRKEMLLKAILENGGGGGGLPVVTQQDDGKVLKVENGQWMAGSNAPLTEISYANLVELRNNEKLIPGMQYRITDYETIINGSYNLSALGAEGYIHYARSTEESWFDIIVTADDESHLNENARAARSDGADYAPDAKPEAWELKYTIDNDSTKYVWADSTHGKGVIYFMRDEHNNSAGYDFKSIQFLRYALKLADATADYTPSDTGLVYNSETHPNRYGSPYNIFTALQSYMQTGTYVNPFVMNYKGQDVNNYDFLVGYNILGTIQFPEVDDTYLSTFNADWYYTFDFLDSNGDHIDISSVSATGAIIARNNCIGGGQDSVAAFLDETTLTLGLTSNVFENNYYYYTNFNTPCSTADNVIGYGSSGITFGANCYDNTLGGNCGDSIFGDTSTHNIFGDGCYGCVLGCCQESTFSANSNNIVSLDCRASTIHQSYLITSQSAIYGLHCILANAITLPPISGFMLKELIAYSANSGSATYIEKTAYNTSTAVSTTDGGATWA